MPVTEQTPQKPSLFSLLVEGEDIFFNAVNERLSGLVKYRARQIAAHIYAGADSFDKMTDIPLTERTALASCFMLRESAAQDIFRTEDGAVKIQIRLVDGLCVEAVLLRDGAGRKTACVSTQAGCPLGCVFCKTGSLGFKRNLSAAEIAEQFFHLKSAGGAVSNIVVMGMGEPLLNLEALRAALVFLERAAAVVFQNKTQFGFGGAMRRVTISTSGIASGIRVLPDVLPGIRLALSITTADEALRTQLMPQTLTNPLPALKEALLYYQSREKKRITLEAVLLGGINTRTEDARFMAEFARGLKVLVNLIPWNPAPGLRFKGAPLCEPSIGETERFAVLLAAQGLKVIMRRKKGRGVNGACGQLGV